MIEKFKIVVDEKSKTFVYFNGKKVNGIRSIQFEANCDDIPSLIIDFAPSVADIEPNEVK